MSKSLNLDAKVTLPTGQQIDLFNHALPISGLEQYAIEAILASTGGKLEVKVDALLTEI